MKSKYQTLNHPMWPRCVRTVCAHTWLHAHVCAYVSVCAWAFVYGNFLENSIRGLNGHSLVCNHRRIQDFVRGGKALLAPRGGGQGPLGPLDPRLTIWGNNLVCVGGGGARPPCPPPLDPRLVIASQYGV